MRPSAILSILVTANTSPAQASLAGLQSQLSATEKQAMTSSAKTGAYITKGAKVGAAGLTVLAAASLKAAIDFEDSFAEVRKTVDATEKKFGQIETGIRNMAKSIPVGTDELNGVAGAAGALGIKANDIVKFTRVAADLGVTTNVSSDQAATSIARIANVMDTKGKKAFERMGSTLVDLGNKGSSTEAEILSMAQRISAAGATVDFTESQVFGLAASLSNVGIPAESGGTAISRVMLDMQSAIASGGAKLRDFADMAGMSTQQFATAFEKNGPKAIQTFVSGLDKIKESGGDVQGALEKVGLNEIRVRNALLSLGNATGEVTEGQRIANKAWGKNNALSVEAEKRYKTTASQIQIFKNRLKDVGITIGQFLLPMFNDALEAVSKFANGPHFMTLIKVLAGTAAGFIALKAAMAIHGTIMSVVHAVRLLTQAFIAQSIAANSAAIPSGFLAKAMFALLHPVQAATGVIKSATAAIRFMGITTRGAMLATGVGALIVAATLIITHWSEVKKFLGGVWKWMKQAAADVGDWIWDKFGGTFKAIAAVAKDAWTIIVDVVKVGWAVIKKVFEIYTAPLIWTIKALWHIYSSVAKIAFGIVKGIVTVGLKLIKGLFNWAVQAVKDVWGTLTGVLVGPLKKAWDFIKFLVRLYFTPFKFAIEKIVQVWGAVKGVIVGPLKEAWNWIKGAFGDIGHWFAVAFGDVKEGIKDALGGIGSFVSGLFNGIKDAIIDVLNFVIDKINFLIRAHNKLPFVSDISEIGLIETSADREAKAAAFAAARTGITKAARASGVGGGATVAQASTAGGQFGGLVMAHGIRGFQAGGMVGPGPRDSVRAMLEPGELVMPKKAVEDTKERAKFAGKVLNKELGDGQKKALDASKKFGEGHTKALKEMGDDAHKILGKVNSSYKATASVSTEALKTIETDLNKALKGLGLQGVSFSLTAGGDEKAQKKQKGGRLVGGRGTGDKVPLMAEPGEVVWNREAVKGMGGIAAMEKANKLFPRFKRGGTVIEALGPVSMDPFVYDANHAGGNRHLHLAMQNPADIVAFGKALRAKGFMVGENALLGDAPAPGVHAAGGYHYTNQAIDINSAADETLAEIKQIIAMLSGNYAAGTAAQSLKALTVQGRSGPFKSIAQAVSDKATKAANAYLAKKSPTGLEGMEGGSYHGKLDRIFPQGSGIQLSFAQVAGLAEKAGLPGKTFAEVAIGESNLMPGAYGTDPGGTHGYGLWQITTGFNEALVRSLGGWKQMFNPWKNALAAKSIYDSQGLGAWYGTSHVTDPNAHWKRKGGGIPTLDSGGRVRRGGLAEVHPGDVHMGGGGPQVTVILKGPGMDKLVEEIEVLVDGHQAEVQRQARRKGRQQRKR